MRLDLDIDGERATVELVHRTVDLLLRHEAGDHVIAGIGHLGHGHYRATVDGSGHDIVVARRGDTFFIRLDDRVVAVEVGVPEPGAHSAGAGADILHAAMPGTVVSVDCAAGDAVRAGQALMVIESMKLQTTIAALHDGTVAAVHLQPGQSFNKGAALVTFAAEDQGE